MKTQDIYWNRAAETMSRDEYAKVQLEGLQKSLRRVWQNDFYRERLKKGGLGNPEDVKSLDDLVRLPFFTKEDFREAYPLKMNCMDRRDLLEFHMSSGSTGTPVVMAYTKNDLNQWAETMARCFTMAGLEKGDAFQIMPTFGLFNGGFGCYHGCRKAGLFCVPASSGNTERQIRLMRDFRVKGFCSVVSYVPRVIEKLDADANGDHDIPSLRVGIFGSETFSDEMRRRIESRLHIECFDIYGMTETGGIGTTGQDCKAHAGIHVWEDQYITEIIDPRSSTPRRVRRCRTASTARWCSRRSRARRCRSSATARTTSPASFRARSATAGAPRSASTASRVARTTC